MFTCSRISLHFFLYEAIDESVHCFTFSGDILLYVLYLVSGDACLERSEFSIVFLLCLFYRCFTSHIQYINFCAVCTECSYMSIKICYNLPIAYMVPM